MPRNLDDINSEEYCPNCGRYTGGDTICPNCGAILNNDDDEFNGFHETEEDDDLEENDL